MEPSPVEQEPLRWVETGLRQPVLLRRGTGTLEFNGSSAQAISVNDNPRTLYNLGSITAAAMFPLRLET